MLSLLEGELLVLSYAVCVQGAAAAAGLATADACTSQVEGAVGYPSQQSLCAVAVCAHSAAATWFTVQVMSRVLSGDARHVF